MLGGRPGGLIARALLEPGQYVAVARMARRYPAFADVLKRYLLGGGDYPYACRVRTPVGIVAPVTYTHHDIFTVQEVFGREDYRAGAAWASRSTSGPTSGSARCTSSRATAMPAAICTSPSPATSSGCSANLAGYERRYAVQEVAVAADGGTVQFTVEPYGRYGGIGVAGSEHIQVTCRAVGDVLDEVLEGEDRIDVLKIDTEGAELETVRAIRADQLARIDTICFETSTPYNPDAGQFSMHFAADTCRLQRRSRLS